MNRYFLELQFKGTHYCGWQIQPDNPTVQAEINQKLSTLLKEPVETVGAGRTDTGVHARHFIAHFDCTSDIKKQHPQLVNKLNQFLPKDIAVQRIIPVSGNAHARFDAIERTYKYYITCRKDVFRQDYSWPLRYHLDLQLMNEGAELIRRTRDFTSFSKLHTDVKTKLCQVKHAAWSKSDDLLIFTISADRFLRNMVRSIVGTLVHLGRKKLLISDLDSIIESKDRSCAKDSAPAKGLFLEEIRYPYGL
jgi:tRNA pseudouridine38-40 synthase